MRSVSSMASSFGLGTADNPDILRKTVPKESFEATFLEITSRGKNNLEN